MWRFSENQNEVYEFTYYLTSVSLIVTHRRDKGSPFMFDMATCRFNVLRLVERPSLFLPR